MSEKTLSEEELEKKLREEEREKGLKLDPNYEKRGGAIPVILQETIPNYQCLTGNSQTNVLILGHANEFALDLSILTENPTYLHKPSETDITPYVGASISEILVDCDHPDT